MTTRGTGVSAERAGRDDAVGASALRASWWIGGGYAAGQLLRFGGNLVLTRLLFPGVFGLTALVAVLLQGLQMFSDVGTGPAIVRSERGDDPRFLDTAWTVGVARGVLLWLAACVLARPAAAFYGEPLLAQILPVAALTAVTGGLESTSLRLAQRRLDPRRITAVDLAGQTAAIAGSIAFVYLYRAFRPIDLGAAWAVVGGTLLGAVVRLVLSHAALSGPPNRLRVDREALRYLLGFGRWMFVSTLLGFLAAQSDRLLLGKMVPLDVLGVYGIAFALAQLVLLGVQRLGGFVLFPAFSRLDSQGRLAATFRRARLPLLIGGAAVTSGFIVCGEQLVAILYDVRYASAGWILQILAVGGWLGVLDATYGAALLAKQRMGWMAASRTAKIVALAAFVPIGMHLGGFAGALVGLVASELVRYAVSAAAVFVAGLGGVRHDALLTVAIAGVSTAAMIAAGALSPESQYGRFFAGAFVVGLTWGAAGLWVLRRHRAEQAARAPAAPSAPAA